MLRDVITGGTATAVKNRLKFNSDWAGKTGTSQDYKDTWFVATNPNVSFGVWNGYDEPKIMESNKGLTYSLQNIYLWAALMNTAYDAAPELVDPSEPLPMPDGIVSRSFCAISGQLPSDACSRAGLVRTDLFNAKFIPTKSDNSLISGKYVTIGNKRYIALDSTPAEFTETGLILNSDAIQNFFNVSGNVSQYIPNNGSLSNALVPNAKMGDNGKTPSSLTITQSGNTISWGNHPEKDIIGYRVYSGGKRVSSMKAGGSLSYQGGNGSYYVTAVDITGKESAPSNTLSVGQPVKTPPAKPEEKPVETPAEAPAKTDEIPATPQQPASPPANSEKTPVQEAKPENIVEQKPTKPSS
jgi:penicillin-binding protein 1B